MDVTILTDASYKGRGVGTCICIYICMHVYIVSTSYYCEQVLRLQCLSHSRIHGCHFGSSTRSLKIFAPRDQQQRVAPRLALAARWPSFSGGGWIFFSASQSLPRGGTHPPPKNKIRREHTLAYMRAHGRNMRANRKGKPCGLFPMFLSVGRQLFGGTYYHPAAYALGVKALRPVWLHSSAI